MNLVNENEQLKSWNDEKVKYILVHEHFHFYAKKLECCDSEAESTALFCANCFQDKYLRILMHGGSATTDGKEKMICPSCKNEYLFPASEPPIYEQRLEVLPRPRS